MPDEEVEIRHQFNSDKNEAFLGLSPKFRSISSDARDCKAGSTIPRQGSGLLRIQLPACLTATYVRRAVAKTVQRSGGTSMYTLLFETIINFTDLELIHKNLCATPMWDILACVQRLR